MTSLDIGLVLACGCAASNALMDVAQKKALARQPLYPTMFCARMTVFATLSVVLLARMGLGSGPPWQGLQSGLLQSPQVVAVLILDCVLVGCSALLYYRALQVSPLSLTVPFLTFTPVFLVVTSDLVLHERPTVGQIEGVAVVVLGSVLMYRSQFRFGWLEPVRALAREPGSRYMLLAALIMSLTNSLDKWLILRSGSYTFAWLYALCSCVFFSVVLLARLRVERPSFRHLAWKAIVLAGVADAATLLLQFAALTHLRAVLTICIKRSGILATVIAGWLIFGESDIGERLTAACVMVVGAMMLYLSLNLVQQSSLMVVTAVLGIWGPRLFAPPPPLPPPPTQNIENKGV